MVCHVTTPWANPELGVWRVRADVPGSCPRAGFPLRLEVDHAHVLAAVDELIVRERARRAPACVLAVRDSCDACACVRPCASVCRCMRGRQEAGGVDALLQYYLASYEQSDFSAAGQQNLVASLALLYIMITVKQRSSEFVNHFGAWRSEGARGRAARVCSCG